MASFLQDWMDRPAPPGTGNVTILESALSVIAAA
jgi:hypothetical protein